MSGAAGTGGIAARLIDRAEGRIAALRPQQANIFAAESARDTALLDRTDEVLAAPSIAPATVPPASVVPPERRAADGIATDGNRLMAPGDIGGPARPTIAGQPLTDAPASIDPDISGPIGQPTAPFAQPTIGATAPAAAEGPTPISSAKHPSVRDTSLSAAIAQLLGSSTDDRFPRLDAHSYTMPSGLAPPHDVSAQVPRDVHQSDTGQDKPEAALNIHIGEIVIAPEPGAPKMLERPAPIGWQPPVSLAEYRAGRASERR